MKQGHDPWAQARKPLRGWENLRAEPRRLWTSHLIRGEPKKTSLKGPETSGSRTPADRKAGRKEAKSRIGQSSKGEWTFVYSVKGTGSCRNTSVREQGTGPASDVQKGATQLQTRLRRRRRTLHEARLVAVTSPR